MFIIFVWMRLICGTLVSYSWELPVSKILYNLQLLSSSLPTNFPSIWAMLVCQNIRFVCFGTMFNKVIVSLLSALAQFMLVIFIYITYLTSSKRGLKVLYYTTMSITLLFVFFVFSLVLFLVLNIWRGYTFSSTLVSVFLLRYMYICVYTPATHVHVYTHIHSLVHILV